MGSFEDADAVALLLTWLRANAEVRGLLGDPSPSVSGINEPPWPHLILTEGLGTELRGGVWSHVQEVELQLRSDPTGMPGKAVLRKLLMGLVRIAMTAPETPVTLPTQAVICAVEETGSVAFQKLSTGQLVYSVSLRVTVRPPTA